MLEKKDLRRLTASQYHDLRAARWKARTDLGWLCREILGYPDVSDKNGGPYTDLHQPLIDLLQKFPIPVGDQEFENDRLDAGEWVYKPVMPMLQLPGKRRTLILDSRGCLKTTINSIAHTIQWIINYPEISILIFMGSDTKATDILGEIKRHFQYNEAFRTLFPEHCPIKSVGDWGRADRFTSEARPKSNVRKEPTIMTGSIEKGAAGYHFDVIKFSDIVDENNIQGNGLSNVLTKFDISVNLLVSPRYWMDVEGTRYHFADTYGKIIERQLSKAEKDREYNMFIRGIFRRKVGGPEKFTMEEGKAPFLKNEDGKRISRWEERFDEEFLATEEKNDPWIFACQRLNYPVSNLDGATPFPVNDKFPIKISREDYNNNVRIAYKEICVDLASTDNKRSNYTVITVGSISSSGKLFIEEIIHGKFLADQAVDKIFTAALKHYRHLKCIKIEQSEYLRGLWPSIQRRIDNLYAPKGIHFQIDVINRGNRTAKADRIYKHLQPYYKAGDLRFLSDIEPLAWKHLIKEMEEFPSSATDDILDAISDFLADKEWYGREVARGNPYILQRDKNTGQVTNQDQLNALFQKVQREKFDRWLQIESPEDAKASAEFADSPYVSDPWFKSVGIY